MQPDPRMEGVIAAPLPGTNRSATGQLLLCRGCCCGREDRGYSPVPVDRIKAAWKENKLNRTVQLTISGCLGPCDAANVGLVLTPDEQIWFGLVQGDAVYRELIEWARECQAAGAVLPLPEPVRAHQMARWPARREGDGAASVGEQV